MSQTEQKETERFIKISYFYTISFRYDTQKIVKHLHHSCTST